MSRANVFRTVILLAFLALLPLSAGGDAGEFRQRFEKAETFYRNGNYQGAVDLYEDILEAGYRSGPLYYNLGNAYFKLGDMGRTVLNYERALREMPEDKELRHNLSFVQDLLQDRFPAAEVPRWLQMLRKAFRIFSFNTLLLLLSLCYTIALFSAAFAVLKPASRRRAVRFVLLPAAVLFVLFSVVGGFRLSEKTFSPAVIVAKEADVHYGPSAHETKAFVLHAGTKCAVRDVSGEWLLIWLPNDQGGWVHQSGLERI